MKRLWLALVVTLALLPVGAQVEDTPACTRAELLAISALVLPVAEEISAFGDRMTAGNIADIPALAMDLDDFQVQWWQEIAPELPECDLGLRVQLLVGRQVDELLIATLLLSNGLYGALAGEANAIDEAIERVDAHIAMMESGGEAMAEITEQLEEEE